MAINTIQYAQLLQKALDEQVVAQSTSGWMEANAGLVQYDGGAEVKIPSIAMQGMGDYDRDEGYTRGSVTVKHDTYKMTMDRGRSFQLDAMDVNESGFVANATSVVGEFQRSQVIPEIDSYRYSKIYSLANESSRVADVYNPAKATILDALRTDIAAIQDIVGEIPLVITMAHKVSTILDSAPDISKSISVVDFKQGSINLKVKAIDEIPIRKVPSARMKTAYIFKDGATGGQEDGGCIPAEGAKQINWIITPANVPIAISKTDTLRIFDPATNQRANAWLIDFRKYHDLWIMKNKMSTVMVNISGT